MKTSQTATSLVIFACAMAALLGVYVALSRTGTVDFLQDGAVLKQWVQQLGIYLAIVSLMATATLLALCTCRLSSWFQNGFQTGEKNLANSPQPIFNL